MSRDMTRFLGKLHVDTTGVLARASERDYENCLLFYCPLPWLHRFPLGLRLHFDLLLGSLSMDITAGKNNDFNYTCTKDNVVEKQTSFFSRRARSQLCQVMALF